ncbi:hypothetical protein EDD17DRAFT_1617002 [Pisolithus thermaeus]|nr:hypothetical protein EDD17DRAFT_1617002 [Pisolithus thermaeus]
MTVRASLCYSHCLQPRLTGAEAHLKVNRTEKDRIIEFFSDLFGLEYLRNYIGEITFFERLPSMLATGSLSEISVDAMEGDGSVLARPPKFPSTNWMMSCLFRDRQHFNTVQDPRLAVTLPLLHRRCQTFHATPSISCWYANEKKKVALEFKSILQSPSSQLFRQVMVTLLDADSKRGACTEATLSGRVDYDGQLNTTSMAQEIEALQVKLDAATDEGEQRALEEDVTGKVRAASSYCLSTVKMIHSLIDPVALLVRDLRRSRRSVTKGRGLRAERRRYEWYFGYVLCYEIHSLRRPRR